MNNFDCIIQEYISEHQGGVLCSVSMHYDGGNYDCMVWYNNEFIFFEIPNDLKEKIGDIYIIPDYTEKIKPFLNKNLEDFEKVIISLQHE